jgi:glycosyltransferase involved in cell wall biosynthesis
VKVVILTDIPSPYQVELFNALAGRARWCVTVIYSRRFASGRSWESLPILHRHFFLTETRDSDLAESILDCDLAVFGGYRPAKINTLMKLRRRSGQPWAFWGERPGFRFPGWVGRQYRSWALREVRSSSAPVWGIGEWAVEGYRSELGGGRRFFNVPYVSNLTSFRAIERRFERSTPCRFLFSGSLIPRKGVDLLVDCFGRLLAEDIDAQLHLLGTGRLSATLKRKYESFCDRVYVHGFKQWHELASVYAQGDILCAPSRYDGWGLVVVEGLAAGMPVISTDRTGAARELIDPQNGWIVPAGMEDALYRAMKSAATLGPERLKTMSEHARQTAMGQDVEAGVERFAHAAELTIRHWPDEIRAVERPMRAFELEG